jgi:Tfp pilus assembly protein PilF
MEAVSQWLNRALQSHQGGNLQQAELLCRQILQVDPQHANALHLLGVIAREAGRSDLAVDYLQKALSLRPAFPEEARNNLGSALRDQGKFDEAIASLVAMTQARGRERRCWMENRAGRHDVEPESACRDAIVPVVRSVYQRGA